MTYSKSQTKISTVSSFFSLLFPPNNVASRILDSPDISLIVYISLAFQIRITQWLSPALTFLSSSALSSSLPSESFLRRDVLTIWLSTSFSPFSDSFQESSMPATSFLLIK